VFGSRAIGTEAVRAALATRFNGIPDVHYGNAEHFVSGNTGISQWTTSGMTNDGHWIEVRACDFHTFRGHKIERKNSFWKIRV
jgi:hypothetical protein